MLIGASVASPSLTSRGRRGYFFRDERCEFSFTATLLSFEGETILTAYHIGHCRDSFPSNNSTTVGYVPLALERCGNPRDFFLKTGNDRGRRVLLQPVGHFSTSDIHLPFIVLTFAKQSNGSNNHISMLISHIWLYDLLEERGITTYRLMYGHTYRNAK